MDSEEQFEQDYGRWQAALESGSFEEVFEALEEAVSCLEEGRLTLERSLRCFELGAELAERCDRMLADAELRVSRLDEVISRLGQSNDLYGARLFDDPDE